MHACLNVLFLPENFRPWNLYYLCIISCMRCYMNIDIYGHIVQRVVYTNGSVYVSVLRGKKHIDSLLAFKAVLMVICITLVATDSLLTSYTLFITQIFKDLFPFQTPWAFPKHTQREINGDHLGCWSNVLLTWDGDHCVRLSHQEEGPDLADHCPSSWPCPLP